MSLRLSNRRKKPDLIAQIISWSNATAVISLFLSVCLVAVAKPQQMNFLDHFFSVQRSGAGWNTLMLNYIGLTLLLSLITSGVGLYFNTKRLQRKGDHINASMVLSLIISAIGLLFFLRYALF